MRKITFALLAITTMFFASCEREDLSAFVGSSSTGEATEITSDSFKFSGTFTLDGGVATSSTIGVFMDTKSGVCSGQYTVSTEPVVMPNGATYFSYNFSNINSENKRIFEVGTTVYYRAYLRVVDTDYSTSTYVYGEEKSFVVPQSKYTIMVYGSAGSNKDYSNVEELLVPIMKSGRDGNVEVTFQYKPSAECQEGGSLGADNDLKGVHRWIVPAEDVFTGIWNDKIIDGDSTEYILYSYNRFALFSEQVGDKNYNMADPSHLTQFINWSMQECPADHYILLMLGQGGGWDLYQDGLTNVTTKAQSYDDNLDDNGMSLVDFISGISSSSAGKLDGIILNESIMATMENIVEMSTVSSCLAGAEEAIYSLDGESLMSWVKSGAASQMSIYDILCNVVDDYCENNESYYTGFGVYDLSSVSQLTTPIAEASTFLSGKYTTSQTWKTAIDKGFTNAAMSYCSAGNKVGRNTILEVREKVSRWSTLTDPEKDEVIEDIATINEDTHYSYCLYDMLTETVAYAESQIGVDPDPNLSNDVTTLKTILNKYDNALKSTTHINCGMTVDRNTPYKMTSPSVCLQSLNQQYYTEISVNNLSGYINADKLSRTSAISNYTNLEFDKKTSWSELLKKAEVSGAPFFNADRRFKQTGI